MDKDEYDDEITVYAACQGCARDGEGNGICSVPGPCQAYPNAEEEPAVEMLMLPPAVITTDNGRLFTD